MARLLLSALAVGIISMAHAQPVPYDCRRTNQICDIFATGGRCSQASGECICTNPAFTGFDCSLPITLIEAVCSIDCNGRGICYDEGFGARCFCDAPYYGDKCQFERETLQCFGDYMIIRVFPHNFAGHVYVSGLPPREEPRCQFAVAPDGNGFIKNLTLSSDPAENPCFPNLSVATNTDGTLIFTYSITVQYSTLYTSFVDEIHIATCEHTLDGLISASFRVEGNNLPGATIQGNTTILKLDIARRMDGVSVVENNIVSVIGDELHIEVRLDQTSRYENFKVENCGAYNDVLTAFTAQKNMVVDGCPPNDSLDIGLSTLTKDAETIRIPFTAFRFNSAGVMHIYCSVRVCQFATDPLCLPNDCTDQFGGAGQGYGRKKRQADKDKNIEVVSNTLFVGVKGPPVPYDRQTQTIAEKSCLQSAEFLAVTAVLGLLLLLTLIVTVYLWVKYSRRERELSKGKYSENA